MLFLGVFFFFFAFRYIPGSKRVPWSKCVRSLCTNYRSKASAENQIIFIEIYWRNSFVLFASIRNQRKEMQSIFKWTTSQTSVQADSTHAGVRWSTIKIGNERTEIPSDIDIWNQHWNKQTRITFHIVCTHELHERNIHADRQPNKRMCRPLNRRDGVAKICYC